MNITRRTVNTKVEMNDLINVLLENLHQKLNAVVSHLQNLPDLRLYQILPNNYTMYLIGIFFTYPLKFRIIFPSVVLDFSFFFKTWGFIITRWVPGIPTQQI